MIKQIFIDSNLADFGFDDGLPERSFPIKLWQKTENTELVGYFANYDGLVKQEDLWNLFVKNDLAKLVNSNSEFLLFFWEKRKNKLAIASDQFGAIPCYFSFKKGRLVLSTFFTKVVDQTGELTVDMDGLITWLLWEWHATTRTIFEEIKIIPPGSVVSIDFGQEKYNVEHLVDLQGFLEGTGEKYTDVAVFAKDWEKMMLRVVGDRVKAVGDLKISADLSSGFDCTLVAYCLNKLLGNRLVCQSKISSVTTEETELGLMGQFAKLHKINLEVLDTTAFDLNDQDLDSQWRKDEAFQISLTSYEYYMKSLESKEIKVQFMGEGGDESYEASVMDLPESFPIQNSFFINVMYLKKFGIEKMFTKEIVGFALSKERFNQRIAYPMIAPISSVIPTASSYANTWEKDIWMMNPFYDTRLIALARRMPESITGKKQDRKFAVLSNLPNIFPKEMFVEKFGTEKAFVGFAKKQKKFVLEILENSALAKLGVIDKRLITGWVESESGALDDPELAIVFKTMMQIDWFLQKNLR